MRVLFFSYISLDNNKYKGGNWVKSLIELLAYRPEFEVAVVYITRDNSCEKKIENNIAYYPVYYKESLINRVICRLRNISLPIICDEKIFEVIREFKPEIIQLFGIETPFGSILRKIDDIPVVVHLQGIISSCISFYFPIGFPKFLSWLYSPTVAKIKKNTDYDLYCRLVNLSKVEKINFQNYKYYLGRTTWDHQLAKMLSPDSHYYHCNEILRPGFYDELWQWIERSKIVISSTMNGELYKGFDTILKTAKILKECNVDFIWNIYGVQDDFYSKRSLEVYCRAKFHENNVVFRGKKNANELIYELKNTTYYVQASHIDNSPNALCEAMIMGVPSIATYVGGVPSLIDNGVNGWLIPDSECYQLAFLIKNLKNNPDEMKRVSLNARKIALERHNYQKVIGQLMMIYKDILKDK